MDLETGTLAVRQTLQRIDGEYQYFPPKTAKSRRTIPLPAMAIQALRRHRTRQLEERLRLGHKWDDQGLVFTGERGQPLHGPYVTRRFQHILEAAGLPRMRFHDLRHSCASLLLA